MEKQEFEFLEDLQQQCINEDLFQNKESLKNFICPIGLGIMSLQGSIVDNCNHIYCGACGKKVNKCPISREPITQRNDIPLPLKNFLGEQIMKCEYFEKGCLWKGKYEDYCKHSEKDCQFSNISIKCEICQKIIKSINFDQHLIDERLQHYEIAKQKMQQKPQQSFDEETLYKEVKISIHPHKLKFAGSRTNGWFCDSLTDAPDKICLSGHSGSSYNHQGAASLVFLCPNSLWSHSYCFKCVQKYKTD